MSDITFHLTDASGKPHKWDVTLHPGGEGYALSLRLTALGLPLVGKVMSVLEGEADATDSIDDAAALAAEVLTKVDGPELTEQLLLHARRDGAVLVGKAFDDAFRGNYSELYEALGRIVAANRFFPLPSTFYEEGAKALEAA